MGQVLLNPVLVLFCRRRIAEAIATIFTQFDNMEGYGELAGSGWTLEYIRRMDIAIMAMPLIKGGATADIRHPYTQPSWVKAACILPKLCRYIFYCCFCFHKKKTPSIFFQSRCTGHLQGRGGR